MTTGGWWPGAAVLALLTGAGCVPGPGLSLPDPTPLANGRVVVVNGSLSAISEARVLPCEGRRALARMEAPVLPGDRWVTELPGGCYLLVARAGAAPFRSKPFDLPPSGAYRVVVRTGGPEAGL